MRRLHVLSVIYPSDFLGVLKMSITPSVVAVETAYGEVTRMVALNKELVDVRTSEGVDVVIRRRPGQESIQIRRVEDGYAVRALAKVIDRMPGGDEDWVLGYAYSVLEEAVGGYEVASYEYERPDLPDSGIAVTALDAVDNVVRLLSFRRVHGPVFVASTVYVDSEPVLQILRMMDSITLVVRAGDHVVLVPQPSCPCEPAAVAKSADPTEIRHYELVDAVLRANKDLVPLGTMVTKFLDEDSEEAKKLLGRIQGLTFM